MSWLSPATTALSDFRLNFIKVFVSWCTVSGNNTFPLLNLETTR